MAKPSCNTCPPSSKPTRHPTRHPRDERGGSFRLSGSLDADTSPTSLFGMGTAIYTRISDVKGRPGVGVERQQNLCMELADKRGWNDVIVFSDDDISAWSGKARPGWESMLDAIRAGQVSAVVAYEPSRLYRRVYDLLPLIALTEDHGLEIATVMGGEVDLTTPQGRAVAKTIATWDEYESDVKSARVKAQRDEAAKNGKWQSRPRYGYTLDDDGQLVVNKAQAKTLRRIISEIIDGSSLRQIATRLNDDNIPTPSGTGRWGSRKVSTLITPTIAGLYVHRRQVVGKGAWEAIVSRADYELARRAMDARKTPGQPAKHLLTGILKCSHCGASMYRTQKSKTAWAYKCMATPEGGCGKLSISDAVEQIVVDAVLDALDSPAMAETLSDMDSPDAEGIVRQLEQAEANLDDLARIYFTEKHISEREYLSARDAIEAKISQLRDQLVPETPTARVRADSVALRALWDQADTTTRRDIIGEVIEEIVVEPGVRGRRTVDPDRLSITWRT